MTSTLAALLARLHTSLYIHLFSELTGPVPSDNSLEARRKCLKHYPLRSLWQQQQRQQQTASRVSTPNMLPRRSQATPLQQIFLRWKRHSTATSLIPRAIRTMRKASKRPLTGDTYLYRNLRSERDPLNWSSAKKARMLAIIAYIAALADYTGGTGIIAVIPQAV